MIAYRQPITRSEIEDVRGVSVSSHIVKSMLEREWVRVIGHRDVPGRPALYGTTKTFLDYFGIKSLSELPPLAELRNIESIEHELDFGDKPAAAENSDQQVEPLEAEQGEVQPVAMAEEDAAPEQAADAVEQAENAESAIEEELSADTDASSNTGSDEQTTTAETAATPKTEQAF